MNIFNIFIKLKITKIQRSLKSFEINLKDLYNRRLYIEDKEIKKIKKKYKKILSFYNSNKFAKTKDKYLTLIEPLDNFSVKYNEINDIVNNLNNIITEYKNLTLEFLSELNLLRKNPENNQLYETITKNYIETYEYINSGSKNKLKEFNTLIYYYTSLNIHIEKWQKIKDHYQNMIKFINIIKQLKMKYIDLSIISELDQYNTDLDYLVKDDIQSEIIWDKEIILKTYNFIKNLKNNLTELNKELLNREIKDKFITFYENKTSLDNYYVTNIIDELKQKYNIPQQDIDLYFELLETKIDDQFEHFIYKNLKHQLKYEFKIIPNVYLATNYSKIPYCQIDLILFFKGSIYVLELKDYSGKIYGSYSSDKWKQIFVNKYSYRNSFKVYTKVNKCLFNNPIKQNEWHIKSLNKIVEFPYKNIVLFSDNSKLFISSQNVFNYTNFLKYLNNQPSYPDKYTNEIYYRICLLNQGKDPYIKEKHVSTLKVLHNNY